MADPGTDPGTDTGTDTGGDTGGDTGSDTGTDTGTAPASRQQAPSPIRSLFVSFACESDTASVSPYAKGLCWPHGAYLLQAHLSKNRQRSFNKIISHPGWLSIFHAVFAGKDERWRALEAAIKHPLHFVAPQAP